MKLWFVAPLLLAGCVSSLHPLEATYDQTLENFEIRIDGELILLPHTEVYPAIEVTSPAMAFPATPGGGETTVLPEPPSKEIEIQYGDGEAFATWDWNWVDIATNEVLSTDRHNVTLPFEADTGIQLILMITKGDESRMTPTLAISTLTTWDFVGEVYPSTGPLSATSDMSEMMDTYTFDVNNAPARMHASVNQRDVQPTDGVDIDLSIQQRSQCDFDGDFDSAEELETYAVQPGEVGLVVGYIPSACTSTATYDNNGPVKYVGRLEREMPIDPESMHG